MRKGVGRGKRVGKEGEDQSGAGRCGTVEVEAGRGKVGGEGRGKGRVFSLI